MSLAKKIDAAPLLPENFSRWFSSRGWTPRAHQLELLSRARDGRSVLLIAPTGGGKTLAGFLPTLVELTERAARPQQLVSTGKEVHRSGGLHTLYISPLKALAVYIARNLETPVREMNLPVRIETRTGDTPASKRQRQRRDPPDILLTTPEQLALLLASADAPFLFGSLRRVILDELHSLVTSKRGDLLSLGLARLFALAPDLTSVGLSATVAEPDDLRRFLVPQPLTGTAMADLVIAEGGAEPDVTMLDTEEMLPWAGHSARHALGEIYDFIRRHKTSLIWSAKAENKCKLFAWVLIQNKLLTADNLARRSWPHQPSCSLCNGPMESGLHMCLSCPFAQEVWIQVLAWENLTLPQQIDPTSFSSIEEWWGETEALFPKDCRRMYNGAVIYTLWNIWKERNRRIFEHSSLTPLQVAGRVRESLCLYRSAFR